MQVQDLSINTGQWFPGSTPNRHRLSSLKHDPSRRLQVKKSEATKSEDRISVSTTAPVIKNNTETAVGAIIKATPVTSPDSPIETTTTIVNEESITYTPVTSLPKKIERQNPQKAEGTSVKKDTTSMTAATSKVTPVTTSKTDGKPEPSVDQARKSVLNSIIEQKIDSILKP